MARYREKIRKVGWLARKEIGRFLKRAQKMYVKRDEEKTKTKARVMAAAIREENT